MSIAVPSIFVSTNDLVTVKNSLQSLVILQKSSGAFPYAGVPFGSLTNAFSFTYHLCSLIGLKDYYQYTGDIDYLSANWNRFKLGLNYSLSMIDSSGSVLEWAGTTLKRMRYYTSCYTERQSLKSLRAISVFLSQCFSSYIHFP